MLRIPSILWDFVCRLQKHLNKQVSTKIYKCKWILTYENTKQIKKCYPQIVTIASELIKLYKL